MALSFLLITLSDAASYDKHFYGTVGFDYRIPWAEVGSAKPHDKSEASKKRDSLVLIVCGHHLYIQQEWENFCSSLRLRLPSYFSSIATELNLKMIVRLTCHIHSQPTV